MTRVKPVLLGLQLLAAASLAPPPPAVAAGTAAAGAAAAGADSRPIDVRYAISLLGLPLGTGRITGTVGPHDYRLEATGRLTGLAGVVMSTRGAATATGRHDGSGLVPATFAATAATSNYTLTIRMAMARGDAKAVEITPPWEPRPDRIPLTPADQHGIVDPVSAALMPVPGTGDVIGPAACDRTLPLFDGGVRFDVILSYAGTRQVKAPGYSGPVAICTARYRPIAGYRPGRPVTRFMTENKEMDVWLAPVAGTRFVIPYRVSVLTMVGTTVIEATAFEAGTRPAPAAR